MSKAWLGWVAAGGLLLGAACTVEEGSSDEEATGGGGASSSTTAGEGGATTSGGGGGGGGAGGGSAGTCEEECTTAADCTINDIELDLACTDGRCVNEEPQCGLDVECVALFNFWTLADSDGDFTPDAPCTADGPPFGEECPAGEVCCSTNYLCLSPGFCGEAPADGTCSFGDVVTAPSIDGASIEVCGETGADDATCEMGRCFDPCSDDDDCGGVLPRCNVATGACECTTDPTDSCADNDAGGTICVDGACSCNDADDCRPVYDGTTPICQ